MRKAKRIENHSRWAYFLFDDSKGEERTFKILRSTPYSLGTHYMLPGIVLNLEWSGGDLISVTESDKKDPDGLKGTVHYCGRGNCIPD